MRFEWDEHKNQENYKKHGLNFADAYKIFESPMLVDLDDHLDYGEDRWIGIGRINDRIVVIIYTEIDDDTIRIISLRKALKYERKIYEQFFRK